jgi:hypothetical protein
VSVIRRRERETKGAPRYTKVHVIRLVFTSVVTCKNDETFTANDTCHHNTTDKPFSHSHQATCPPSYIVC